MKNWKTFALVALMGSMAFGFESCKKNKEVAESKPQDEVLVNVYCSGPEYFTNKEYFRSNAIGESLDQMTAKKKSIK